jgi:phosphoglycerol geranylgeranyltransferase
LSSGRVEKYLIERSRKSAILAALVDPEDFTPQKAAQVAQGAESSGASVILVGGSTISNQQKLDDVVVAIKKAVTSHVILFPGNITGVSHHADAILFSSLLNSTNPYFIVGAQALGAMEVYKSGIESIPMGYLVFGDQSSTSFIGQVNPLPPNKQQLAVIYSLAAKFLGMRTLYLEAGSGATNIVPEETISAVRKFYDGFIIAGGGITTSDVAARAAKAGADMIVVGNLLSSSGFEGVLAEMTSAIKFSRLHR